MLRNRKPSSKKELPSTKYNLKVYFSLLKNKKAIYTTIILLALLAEAILLADKLLYKTIIDKATLFVANEITKDVFLTALIMIAVIFGALSLGRMIMNLFLRFCKQRVEAGLEVDLKKMFFSHLLSLSHNIHATH